mmetsp:Transcript_122558/g.392218  ORF Transcript_122558/g.392218 Transcript_122558/m.392218 type:complete len:258 (+) Transcript_122558:2177-2950(+)
MHPSRQTSALLGPCPGPSTGTSLALDAHAWDALARRCRRTCPAKTPRAASSSSPCATEEARRSPRAVCDCETDQRWRSERSLAERGRQEAATPPSVAEMPLQKRRQNAAWECCMAARRGQGDGCRPSSAASLAAESPVAAARVPEEQPKPSPGVSWHQRAGHPCRAAGAETLWSSSSGFPQPSAACRPKRQRTCRRRGSWRESGPCSARSRWSAPGSRAASAGSALASFSMGSPSSWSWSRGRRAAKQAEHLVESTP